jgi:hypothetical protein
VLVYHFQRQGIGSHLQDHLEQLDQLPNQAYSQKADRRYMGLLHPEVLLTNNAITTTGWRIFGTYTPKDQNLNHPTYNIRS